LGLAAPAAAQASLDDAVPRGRMRFRVFAGADGLRNLVVGSVTQAGDGLLWLGTEDGVYRFDGERFHHFGVRDGLLSSLTRVVGVAPDGRPCVGSDAGLVCWDGARFSPAGTRGLPAVPVRTMARFAGKLWVGTDDGLYVEHADATGRAFMRAPGWRSTAPVRALWADPAGLVIGDGGTVVLGVGDGVWRDLRAVGLTGDRVDGVVRDRQGAVWIRTQRHMWWLPAGASRATDLAAGLPSSYNALAAPTAMAIGPRGDVLIGTDAGIAYRDRDAWATIDRAAGLPAAATRALFVDREGSIWIGAAGLIQLRGRGLIERHDEHSGLPGDTVWSYARDAHGTLWIGTSQCLVRAVARRWECLPGTQGRVVRSFVFAPDGGVFIGGAPADLLHVDPAGRTRSLGEFGHPPGHNILAMVVGPDGDLWLGTRAGLYVLRAARPGPLERVTIPGVAADARVSSVVVAGGRLWIASAPGGLAVRDGGGWRVFDQRAGFRASSMTYLMQRSDGRLCTAYTEAIGLTCFRYDGAGVAELSHLGELDGLTSGIVYLLGEDRARRLWVGTGDGVDVVTATGIDHLDDADGLAGNDSSAMAFLVDADGSLWLGSTGGATHVLAQFYRGPPEPPDVVLLDGWLGDRPLRGAPLAGLEVAHDRGVLGLAIAAGSLLDARRVEYQVRLSPLERDWTSTRQRQARYPGLPPGSYRFEARARVGAGGWGPVRALAFTVRQAWWRAPWFVVPVAIVALAGIAAGFAWRQRAVIRRRTRQLHAETDASFRAVIDLMPDLVSVHRGRKLIYLNRASCRLLGIEPHRGWEGVDLADRLHPDDRAAIGALFARVSAHDAVETSQVASPVVELRVRRADRSWRSCEVSLIRVELGGALTVIASGRDVTDRNRLRAKLLVSDRMASLGTLAAGIAHEINNPLAFVTGNLEVIEEAIDDPDAAIERAELRAAIRDARDGAERVRKIVHGLRAFSRPDEDKRVALEVPAVLETAIRMVGNEIRHRAQLVREFGPVPAVTADDGQLTQVFINLLINAAHAIPAGRSDSHRITVRTRCDARGHAVIEVEDTGIGIAPDVALRVFDPFFTTKEIGEGTGLGLAICHGIISGLGGQISIESAPVRGTILRVVLPPSAGVAALASPTAPAEVRGRAGPRPRVLLVDDEPMVVQTMARLLRRDYDIATAACAKEAIEHVTGGLWFAAIVSDVMMPNMTGIELLEELQRLAPAQAQRVILLSGGAFTAQTAGRLAELGVLQLAKPVSAQDLRACLARVIGAGPPPVAAHVAGALPPTATSSKG
jgi:PAS domain S-box-containing protein